MTPVLGVGIPSCPFLGVWPGLEVRDFFQNLGPLD